MKTKTCTKCSIEKDICLFSKDKNTKDGYMPICKQCIKDYHNKNKKQLNKTRLDFYKKFSWRHTLKAIKDRCNTQNNKDYHRYGGRGIKCMITSDELEILWNRDKAWLLKKPSIDRKDNDGNYEFNNCRYIEHVENTKKDKIKPVLQFDLKGNLIKEWASITEASQNLNIATGDICDVAHHKRMRKTAGGFKWEYKLE